ncbi:potassium transporter-domain-containing protein [Cladochytrium replicatum]|nr:potassium transporter-domain-containing protein [Cladochytrium replicatum]
MDRPDTGEESCAEFSSSVPDVHSADDLEASRKDPRRQEPTVPNLPPLSKQHSDPSQNVQTFGGLQIVVTSPFVVDTTTLSPGTVTYPRSSVTDAHKSKNFLITESKFISKSAPASPAGSFLGVGPALGASTAAISPSTQAMNDKILVNIKRKIAGLPPLEEEMTKRPSLGGNKLGGRRMSLGAALCIPPPPRLSKDMSLNQLIQLTLGAIGIVFGDIGVSPLFVLKAVLKDESKLCSEESTTLCGDPLLLSISENTILGYLSLIIWTLTLICCIKYIVFVLRADKNGEGGTFALISLLPTENEESALWKHKAHIFTGAMLSACFILADGFIAPSMAVLSAIEGMTKTVGKLPNVNTAMIGSAVVPTTILILLILFMVQRFGTHSVEKFAWPVMVMWFLSIAAIGLFNIIVINPGIFQAFSPHHIGYIFKKGAAKTFAAINHTVLAVVGVETLYADLGHFTTLPIRIGFLGVVYPALILSYLGQGSNIIRSINLRDPLIIYEVATDPFFSHVPSQVQVPMVVLATIAAIIASQATLSGCFSLLDQAISLGVFPNVSAIHENQNGSSAVYVPFFNYICMAMCLLIVGVFQHTDAIAEMYGICVTGSMLITSILLALVMRYRWEYKIWQVAPFAIFFGSIDLFFFAAAVQKVASYGWIAILASFILFYVMYTWTTTTAQFKHQLESTTLTMSELRLYVKTLVRTQGTVAFVSNTDEDVPVVLNVCAAKLRALPENIVCMSAVCMPTPFIAEEERYIFRTIDPNIGLYRLVISYGYAERSIDTQAAIQRATKRGLKVAQDDSVLFVVGREIVKSDHETRYFQQLLNVSYDFIARNSQNKADYFNLPAASTLEMGVSNVLR